MTPQLGERVFVDESAVVIGDVQLAAGASLWPTAVARGDVSAIVVGEGSNVQDGAVLHGDNDQPVTIGADVTIGHRAVVHGATLKDGCLIGIGAIVLNGAKIGRHCLVGAGALVTEGKEFPDGSMIIGSPAKAVRQLTPEQIEGLKLSAQHYMDNARRFRAGLKKLG